MMCWTQGIAQKIDDDFPIQPCHFLKNYWKGGPWAMQQPNGRVWRSMVWLGLREGIDDSRYLRSARQWIETAEQSFDPRHQSLAKAAQQRVDSIMDRVPWVSGVRDRNTAWSGEKADEVRRQLAQVALDLKAALNRPSAPAAQPNS